MVAEPKVSESTYQCCSVIGLSSLTSKVYWSYTCPKTLLYHIIYNLPPFTTVLILYFQVGHTQDICHLMTQSTYISCSVFKIQHIIGLMIMFSMLLGMMKNEHYMCFIIVQLLPEQMLCCPKLVSITSPPFFFKKKKC